MTLKLNTHMILQVLATLVQVGTLASGYFPKYQLWITGGVAALQAFLAYVSHHSTPDGNRIPPGN